MEFGGAVAGSGSIIERGEGDSQRTLMSVAPSYSKTTLGDHLTFENYVSSGLVEVPEVENTAHVLILRTGSPSLIEWRSNGRDHRVRLSPGTTSLLPVGLRQAAKVFRPLPGVGSILQIQPAFLDRGIGGSQRAVGWN
jgi:hypothetical protein